MLRKINNKLVHHFISNPIPNNQSLIWETRCSHFNCEWLSMYVFVCVWSQCIRVERSCILAEWFIPCMALLEWLSVQTWWIIFPLSLDLLPFNETASSLECRIVNWSQCSVQSQFTRGMFAMVLFSMVPLVALCLSIQGLSQAGWLFPNKCHQLAEKCHSPKATNRELYRGIF